MAMDAKQRSQFAKAIIENPLWKELFKEAKVDLFEEFCLHTDMHSRERIAMAVDMIDDLQVKIEAWLDEGVKLKIVGDNSDGS